MIERATSGLERNPNVLTTVTEPGAGDKSPGPAGRVVAQDAPSRPDADAQSGQGDGRGLVPRQGEGRLVQGRRSPFRVVVDGHALAVLVWGNPDHPPVQLRGEEVRRLR